MEQKALQVGATVLALALLLRLFGTWEGGKAELGKTLLFFSTGRMVTQIAAPERSETTEPETLPPSELSEPAEAAAIPVRRAAGPVCTGKRGLGGRHSFLSGAATTLGSDGGKAYGADSPQPCHGEL